MMVLNNLFPYIKIEQDESKQSDLSGGKQRGKNTAKGNIFFSEEHFVIGVEP